MSFSHISRNKIFIFIFRADGFGPGVKTRGFAKW